MGKVNDLTGRRFGMLLVVKQAPKDPSLKAREARWECLCDCQNTIIVSRHALTEQRTTSCGCKRSSMAKQQMEKRWANGDCEEVGDLRIKFTTHGLSEARTYSIWKHMKQRCYNSKSTNYKDYGARGIKICDEWKNSFESFHEWAIENGYSDDLTIDRINVNGDYEPNNCRWATEKEQQNNKRISRIVEIDGVKKTIAQWSEETGVNWDTIYYRNSVGYKGKDIIAQPSRRKKQ